MMTPLYFPMLFVKKFCHFDDLGGNLKFFMKLFVNDPKPSIFLCPKWQFISIFGQIFSITHLFCEKLIYISFSSQVSRMTHTKSQVMQNDPFVTYISIFILPITFSQGPQTPVFLLIQGRTISKRYVIYFVSFFELVYIPQKTFSV